MTINEYKYNVLNNYFSLLKNEGYVNSFTEDKIIIIEIVDDLINGDFKHCDLGTSYEEVLKPIIDNIIGSDCLFEYPYCKC